MDESQNDTSVDLDAVQSLLAISRWSPPTPDRSIASPDSGNSSISRNSSSASLSSTCSTNFTEDESSNGSSTDYDDKVSCICKNLLYFICFGKNRCHDR